MLKDYVLRYGLLFRWSFLGCRYYSQRCATQGQREVNDPVSFIRNFGLLAHIDAGKTTTTERMLYYAGSIRSMGEVHHGNTVTDYMEEERLRGITISSVAVTFLWNKHRFNLVDTPGHIDFTMEVEQTLGVLDGGVILLDGSAGVEAQTVTVWRQADRYALPTIIYVNKMDRNNANFSMCLDSIQLKLGAVPLPVQLPIYESGSGNSFQGVIDVITLEKLIWDTSKQGLTYKRISLDPTKDELWKDAAHARAKLVEQMADLDDHLADLVIRQESLECVSSNALMESLRRVTLTKQGVPVVCGSSYKNVGVQSLMDAVIHFLPPPSERNMHLVNCFGSNLCARAFKVIHDDQKRPVTFFRVFCGKLSKGQKVYNIHQERTEQVGKLMVAFADESEEISEVMCGNIAAVTGLKHTVVGDLVTTNAATASAAHKKLTKLKGFDDSDTNDLFGIRTRIPDPVFFCSIEPPSKSYQLALEQALQELQREDPSLRVTQNEETGQTVLGGMGELHLEIIKNRVLSEYKIDVELGDLQIAYKETIGSVVKDTHTISHKIGSSSHSVTVTLSLIPNESEERELLLLDRSPDNAANIAAISFKHLHALKLGVESAMTHGPKLSCPLVNVQVMLHYLEVGRGTSDTIISASVAQCIRKLLEVDGTRLMEPVMNLEVVTNEQNSSAVLADLSRRRTVVQNISSRGHYKVLNVLAPLSELLGYSTDLRTITSGTASFTMEFHCYELMSSQDEAKAIKSVTGFI